MHRKIVIFEVEGGSDKGIYGHRKDTMPIAQALAAQGWEAEVVFYRPEWVADIVAAVVDTCDAYISRVNPGSVPGGEAGYFQMLRTLSDRGLVGMQHPDEMIRFGSKDVLVHLRDTALVPDDTYAYYTIDEMRRTLPTSLSFGERVLKQNRGSTGTGIWRVDLAEESARAARVAGEPIAPDTVLRCTEAVDNHVEEHTLEAFMHFCEQYIVGENGMLVDMRFMPRIVEGEIRVLLVGEKPAFVVHKKPAQTEGAFSATLFSGAQYTYQSPAEWPALIDMFLGELPEIRARLDVDAVPLLWTADFMLDTAPDGSDTYVLGEINCSCVGFTSQLDQGIQEMVAVEAVRQVTARSATAAIV